MQFLAKKSLASITEITKKSTLKKFLGSWDIVLMGVGAMVGGGVFVLSGFVSAQYSGPAIILSYCIAGFISLFMAFFYLELNTMLPNSAAIYNYSYNIFGEIFAWLGFWLVLLEFSTAAASVAVGWSKYFYGLIENFVSVKIVLSPFEGGVFNVVSAILVLILSIILFLGINFSKRSSNTLVFIKFFTIFLFIVLSAKYFNIENFEIFIPFGFKGVLDGSALLFYSFNGYSLLSSAVEECKNPVKNLTLGLIFSVLIAIIIYLLVAFFLNGAVHYTELYKVENPLALVFKKYKNYNLYYLIIFGVIFSMVTGVLINMYAITRIVYSVGRDKLLPSCFTRLKTGNIPYVSVIYTSILVSLLAGLCPLSFLGHISSISSIGNGIILLVLFVNFRIRYPKLPRVIKIPFVKIVLPVLFIAMIYLLIIQFTRNSESIIYLYSIIIWLILGVISYFWIKKS